MLAVHKSSCTGVFLGWKVAKSELGVIYVFAVLCVGISLCTVKLTAAYSSSSINSDEWPDRFESPPTWQDDITDLLEVHGQERRNVTLSSQEEVDGSGNGTGANDAPVADSAPAEQGAEEEDTQSSDSVSSSAQQGAVIRCPLCMEFYSEMMQHGQQLVATLCGHVFCSRCLPIALGVAHICPTCRVKLNAAVYFPIYL
nr:peroxisome biogenesis factor 10-like [Taeniopygia guttata]